MNNNTNYIKPGAVKECTNEVKIVKISSVKGSAGSAAPAMAKQGIDMVKMTHSGKQTKY